MGLKKLNEKKYSIPTQLIYGKSLSEEWDFSHHVIQPMTLSTTFRLDSTKRGAQGFLEFAHHIEGEPAKAPIYIYDRLGEPTTDTLQDLLATAEEGEIAVTFSSGMAAIHSAIGIFLEKDIEIISHKTIYGCTYSLFTNWLPKFGVKVHFIDLKNEENIYSVLNKKTKIIYFETPSNPNLEVIDLKKIADLTKEINKKRNKETKIYTIVDNTFATPFCQRPLKFGIDIVVHSLTKHLSGFGTDMGGVIITRKEFQDLLLLFRKDYGGVLSPRSAWHISVFGLSTLPLRIKKMQENAIKVAEFLNSHHLVEEVSYPGLPSFPQYEIARKQMIDYDGNFAPGSMVYFKLKGKDPEETKKNGQMMMDYIVENAYTLTLAVSLGQLRTLIEHPASMTHSAYPVDEQIKRGIDPGGIRISLGIESTNDIINDLKSALDYVAESN